MFCFWADDKYTEEEEGDRMRTRSPLRESSNYGANDKSQRHRSRYSQHKERDRYACLDMYFVWVCYVLRKNKRPIILIYPSIIMSKKWK